MKPVPGGVGFFMDNFYLIRKIPTFEFMKLKQKNSFRRREFELKGNILQIKTKSLSEINEWSINIEFLGEERFYKSQSRIYPAIFGLFFIAFMIFCIVIYLTEENKSEALPVLLFGIGLGGGIGVLCFLFPLKNELHLVGGSKQIMFFINKPSKKEMHNFIDEVIKRSRKILLSKYGRIDPDLPEETQMDILYWLKDRNIITTEKFEELRDEYRRKRL